MARPKPLPAARLSAGDFLAESAAADLVYFLCNVGDADAQLVLLPPDPVTKFRQAIVVDAGAKDKCGLTEDLIGRKVMADDGPDARGSIAPVVATHPRRPRRRPRPAHRPVQPVPDQRVLGRLLAHDPGLPRRDGRDRPAGHIVYAQPTSGFRRWIGLTTAITVLSPSVQLGTGSTRTAPTSTTSVSIRIEAPATRVTRDPQGHRIVRPRSAGSSSAPTPRRCRGRS
jgi:hypothetical protein